MEWIVMWEMRRLESEAEFVWQKNQRRVFRMRSGFFLVVFFGEKGDRSSRLSRDEIVGGSGRDGMGLNQDGRKLSRLEKRNSKLDLPPVNQIRIDRNFSPDYDQSPNWIGLIFFP